MRKITLFIGGLIGFLLTSCGGGSVKIAEGLSPEEAQAVIKTEKSLPAGAKIENYQVVTSTLPLAIMETEYKSYRDAAYKARLDYRTNMTRGLTQVAEKNLATLQEIQNDIISKDEALKSQSPEYIFVLANVKERSRNDGNLTGFISIFDPQNLEPVDLIQVTTPLYNNAVMVTEALEGTLANPQPTSPGNLKTTNPIVDFILKSSPK